VAGSGAPHETASGVYCLTVGKGLMRANVYFVRSGPSWTLVDTGAPDSAPAIQKAAESLFGAGSRPVAILLTHDHPDHSGSARELQEMWGCPVWVHPKEEPIAQGGIPQFHEWANPLDRWVVLPAMRLLGRRRAETMVAKASLRGVARAFDPSAGVPGLPDWEAVHTPGHTPGHVAFFRRDDRVLISGAALVTVSISSLWGLVLRKPRVSGPPWYVTWNRRTAKVAIASLARLEPLVVAGGHGLPVTGSETPGKVRALSERLWRR
jgi:glyoxylase-like metal-dependent hydrolase (beta-lactamase superfamily II)